jgi:hypothetical protein
MTDAVYEILIRGNPDGTISGVHVAYWKPSGNVDNPMPVDPAAVAAQIAELQAEVAALKAAALEA